jgi:broad specificity phosphatase PhoE
MPTRVFLVRHGATALTAEDRFAGSTDAPLSDEGRRQVASLAERLKGEMLDADYVAPDGGESGLSVLNRAPPMTRLIVERHRHRSVLVISHKGTNRLLISSLLGFDIRGYRDRLDQSAAALTGALPTCV